MVTLKTAFDKVGPIFIRRFLQISFYGKPLEASLDDIFVGHLLLKLFPDFHGTEGAQ